MKNNSSVKYAGEDVLSHQEAAKYAGQWVAMSMDGDKIYAAGETIRAVRDAIQKRNIDPATVVMAFIPPPDEAVIL